jgi:hypothetical protein
MASVCMYCGEVIEFLRERGWVHRQGGSYMMYCPECGWRGAPYPGPGKCPACGSNKLRDDHMAIPLAVGR